MPRLIDGLGVLQNPFEHYTAETEPHISEYAVKPPYLSTIAARARTPSSFILFGDRGAGKSATRLTLYSELWSLKAQQIDNSNRTPLPVHLIDFSRLDKAIRADTLQESEIICEVAYLVVEAVLAWLSSLEEEDRERCTNALTTSERTLIVGVIRAFYLNRPENERRQSEGDALRFLNQAWTTKSLLWVGKRWEPLSQLLATLTESLARRHISPDLDISKPIDEILRGYVSSSGSGTRTVLGKLVEFTRAFGFSGIVVLVDKVDETSATQNSAQATTRVVFPILSHVQLLEVEGFAWQFFLWSQTKPFMEDEQFRIRLDKIAHASINWDVSFFRQMLDARISYFSNGKLKFEDLLSKDVRADNVVSHLVEVSVKSPRELIRLMDIIIREHDIDHGEKSEITLLNSGSIEKGQDVYVRERITAVYTDRTLGQIFRLGETRFTNKDVQTVFRVNAQSARAKIKGWEDAGLAKLSGTRAAEGDLGGKPQNEYSILDTRVERIIRRKLIVIDQGLSDDEEV